MQHINFSFVSNQEEIAKSILSFNSNPDLYREMLRTNPKYFPFLRHGDKIFFALSKFAAFNNVTPAEYIAAEGHRYQTRGGVTQKEIRKVVGKEWQHLESFPLHIQRAFKRWITDIYSGFKTHNFYLMEIDASNVSTYVKDLSPEQLAKKLLRQSEIGKIGEEIALSYEKKG